MFVPLTKALQSVHSSTQLNCCSVVHETGQARKAGWHQYGSQTGFPSTSAAARSLLRRRSARSLYVVTTSLKVDEWPKKVLFFRIRDTTRFFYAFRLFTGYSAWRLYCEWWGELTEHLVLSRKMQAAPTRICFRSFISGLYGAFEKLMSCPVR